MSKYEFGRSIKSIRENLKLKQEDVEFLSGISVRTISRLENGNIDTPYIDTLIALSKVYNEDIIELYLINAEKSMILYKSLLKQLDFFIGYLVKDKIINLMKIIDFLKSDINSKNNYYNVEIIRVFLNYLIQDDINYLVYSFKDINRRDLSSNNLLKLGYSPMELRILINICNEYEEFMFVNREDILSMCISRDSDVLTTMLAYNSIINSLYIEEKYSKALLYINQAIIYTEKNKAYYSLANLYYSKFICEFELNNPSSIESLYKSKLFSEHLGNKRLMKVITEKSNSILYQ